MAIKILANIEGFEDKVNFFDSRDCYVVYDLSQRCCESTSWKIVDSEGNEVKNPDLEEYVFDTRYFEEGLSEEDKKEDVGTCYAKFKMFDIVATFFQIDDRERPLKPDLFLILENTHNGYYSHGFIMIDSYKPLHWGRL
jgi:hypothetical protein